MVKGCNWSSPFKLNPNLFGYGDERLDGRDAQLKKEIMTICILEVLMKIKEV